MKKIVLIALFFVTGLVYSSDPFDKFSVMQKIASSANNIQSNIVNRSDTAQYVMDRVFRREGGGVPFDIAGFQGTVHLTYATVDRDEGVEIQEKEHIEIKSLSSGFNIHEALPDEVYEFFKGKELSLSLCYTSAMSRLLGNLNKTLVEGKNLYASSFIRLLAGSHRCGYELPLFSLFLNENEEERQYDIERLIHEWASVREKILDIAKRRSESCQ